MTAGPSARLLAAFCALAETWLAADKARCEAYGGRFEEKELEQVSVQAPAVRASCLGVAAAQADTDGSVAFEFRLAAIAIGRRLAKGEPEGAQAARLASRIAFELGREQRDSDGKNLWPRACFSAAELDKAREGGSRGSDIGAPREIRCANLYSDKLHDKRIALWAVTWTQQFRALASDFDLPLPAPAGIPAAVLSGRAPEIGTGHEGDYDAVAGEGA